MKLNKNIKIGCGSIFLVPYRPKHVERYHAWMNSEELLMETASQRLTLEEEKEMQQKWLLDEDKCTFIILDADRFSATKNEEISMIGDTNIFLSRGNLAEAEIMIAEKSHRSMGKGKLAMLAMLRYGFENLNIITYIVKIGVSNVVSLSLFQKLGFTKTSYSDVFEENTLTLNVTNEWKEWNIEHTPNYNISSHL